MSEQKFCKECQADITHRGALAIYCVGCSRNLNRLRSQARFREKYKQNPEQFRPYFNKASKKYSALRTKIIGLLKEKYKCKNTEEVYNILLKEREGKV